MAGHEQRYRTSLVVTDGPSRRWSGEDYDIKPSRPPRYAREWTEKEVEYVILHPTLTFDEIGAELGRSPGAVNALRFYIRAVGGATSNAGGWMPEDSHRARLVRKLLNDLGFDSWTDEQRRRYLVRGPGRRSDKTQKAELIRRGCEGQRSKRK